MRGLQVRNRYSGEWTDAARRPLGGFPPTALNRPITKDAPQPEKIWSGRIRFDRDTVIRTPVQITAGTEIRLDPGISLVFRRKLTAIGTTEAPITILRTSDDASLSGPWGTIALQGAGTRGSRLRHMKISGGSGDNIEAIPYTGMLSIHETSDILLEDLHLGPNQIEDDTLHLVYVDNAVIRNLVVESAFGDGVDIDISQAIFDGGRVLRSKNDGIDLMSSDTIITGMEISGSGDKGVSVGERSRAIVHNSTLQQNKIGVESKDASRVTLTHVDLKHNTQDLNAYKKNWRYGGGGMIETFVSRFSAAAQVPSADKQSSITLFGAAAPSGEGSLGKRVSVKPVPDNAEDLKKRLGAFPLSGRARNGLGVNLEQVGTIRRGASQ